MRSRRPRTLCLLAALAICALGARSGATEEPAPYEVAPAVTASAVLPETLRRGPHHEVREEVATYHLLHEFVVTSPYGEYRALSRRLLEIRVHEIETMAGVVGMDGAPEFLRALGNGLAALPTAAAELVIHPESSLRKVGEGIGKTFDRVGDAFKGRRRTPYEDSAVENVFHGDEKRKLAADLGLDVYSTNPQVRRFLDEIASARAGGNLTIDLASFALPVVGYVAVTTAKWRADVDRLLRDRTPAELDRHNAYVLMDLGVPRPRWRAFLGHVWLSPRHKTVITAALKQMEGVEGLEAVLEAATTAQSEVGALMQEQQAVLLAHHHAGGHPFVRLDRFRHLVAGTTEGGEHVLFVPVDLLHWTADLESLADEVRRGLPGSRRLLVTGRVTETARARLARRGFEVVPEYAPAR